MNLALDTCEEVGSLLVFPLHELVQSLCLIGSPLLGELALARTENEDEEKEEGKIVISTFTTRT